MGADVSKKKKKKEENKVYAYKMKLINKVKTMVSVALSSCYLYLFFSFRLSVVFDLSSEPQKDTHNIERKLEGGTRSAATNLSYRATKKNQKSLWRLFFSCFLLRVASRFGAVIIIRKPSFRHRLPISSPPSLFGVFFFFFGYLTRIIGSVNKTQLLTTTTIQFSP